MNADEFATRLAALAPDMFSLRNEGLTARDAEEIRSQYVCGPRRGAGREERDGDPLLDLLRRYDTSTVTIRMIHLFPPRKTSVDQAWLAEKQYVLVGKAEADPLVLSRETHQVLCLDHETPDSLARPCATDSGRFLDACLLLAEFELPYVDPPLDGSELNEDQSAANRRAINERATRCAEAAGLGQAGRPFYVSMLG